MGTWHGPPRHGGPARRDDGGVTSGTASPPPPPCPGAMEMPKASMGDMWLCWLRDMLQSNDRRRKESTNTCIQTLGCVFWTVAIVAVMFLVLGYSCLGLRDQLAPVPDSTVTCIIPANFTGSVFASVRTRCNPLLAVGFAFRAAPRRAAIPAHVHLARVAVCAGTRLLAAIGKGPVGLRAAGHAVHARRLASLLRSKWQQ